VEPRTEDTDKNQQQNIRGRYEPPKLVEYGNVIEITQRMDVGSFADAEQMTKRMPGMMALN
jgi:hypothetical protein